MTFSSQGIGPSRELGQLVESFGVTQIQEHLRVSSSNGLDGSLAENDSPLVLHCEDNLEQEGCASARKVLTSEGTSLAFNLPNQDGMLLEKYRGFFEAAEAV